jgi:hypothetical protein
MKDTYIVLSSLFFLAFGVANLYWYHQDGDWEDLAWGLGSVGFSLIGIITLL